MVNLMEYRVESWDLFICVIICGLQYVGRSVQTFTYVIFVVLPVYVITTKRVELVYG